ncbi:MAG: 16S rRNA (uracil(1498)-N(3))-methyltransferase [Treponema sp.]|nr:16S rRNA (uracil(1498)-N(3))-methyltransferase [Treponema sp.]
MNVILFEEGELGRPLARGDERARHILRILRKKKGERFDAGVIGLGTGAFTIEEIAADGSLAFSPCALAPPPERPALRLAVGHARPIQLRRVLRDLSSMGARAIDVFGADLGEKSYRDAGLFKDGGARAALIEGASQSRDATLPELRAFESVDEWLRALVGASALEAAPDEGRLLIAADNERPQGGFSGLPARPGGSALVAIGPERGWSDRERALLEAAGFARLAMGRRAMRVETACVAAAALALEKIGEFG